MSTGDDKSKTPAKIAGDANWARLLDVAQCRVGEGVFVQAGGRELAVFAWRDDDPAGKGAVDDGVRYAVLDNTCPHAGGNLSGGPLYTGDQSAGSRQSAACDRPIVACPWHHWEFDLTTGICVHSRLARVRVYPVRVRDGAVYADLAGGKISFEAY